MKRQKEIKSLVGITVFFLVSVLIAQPPDTLWTKVYGGPRGDGGHSVRQTSDGGFIIGGSTWSFGQYPMNFWLLKTDINGETLWTRTYGTPNSTFNDARSVRQTFDGGYVIAGYTASPNDVLVIKTDANGDKLWMWRTYGGDGGYAYSIQQTSDSGYIITGGYEPPALDDIYLIKLDKNGRDIWRKIYGHGPYSHESGWDVQQTSDGGYIIAGRTDYNGSNWYDVWLLKTDSVGDTLWARTYGKPAGEGNEYANSVKQTPDGGYIILGGITGYQDVYLIRTDSIGDTIWTKTFGGPYDDGGNEIQPTSDGGYIIVGDCDWGSPSLAKVWLLKIDANGESLWTKKIGRSEGGQYGSTSFSVQQTSDSGYIVTGWTDTHGAGGADVYLIKVGPDIIGIEENKEEFPIFRFVSSFNRIEIKYTLPHRDHVKVKVYEINGRIVGNILDEIQDAGDHTLTWNKRIPQGIYFIHLETSDKTYRAKTVIVH